MEGTDRRRRDPATSRSLREAIHQARLKEAAEIDGAAGRRSTELARLEVLKAALERTFDDIPEGDDRFHLVLAPSFPARLWIDMFAYVTLDPGDETYRLNRNGRQGRRVLAETREAAAMAGAVQDYVAAQIVARERHLDGFDDWIGADEIEDDGPPEPRARTGLVVAAFVVGVLTGIVGLYALATLLPA